MRTVLMAAVVLLALLSISNLVNADQTITTVATTTTTVVTTKNNIVFSATITCPRDAPPQGIPFGFGGNSSQYETYDIEMFFIICGHFVQYERTPVVVLYAFINKGDYQNAASLSFSFDNAHYWLNSTQSCNLAIYPSQPAVQLHLIRNATAATSQRPYAPPVYAGQTDLCFAYPADYRPVFLIDLPSKSPIQLHQNPGETPYFVHVTSQTATQTTSIQSHVNQSVTETQNSTTQSQNSPDPFAWFNDSWVVKTLGNVLTILLIVGLVVPSIIAVWKRRVISDFRNWGRI